MNRSSSTEPGSWRRQAEQRAQQARQRAPVRVGEWLLHADTGSLVGSQGEVRILPKPLAVLLVLIDADGQVVTRDQLLDQVWGEGFPSEQVLPRAIADLRQALGDSAGEQSYIKTVPKHGYQLVAKTEVAQSTSLQPASEKGMSFPGRSVWVMVVLVMAGVWLWNRQPAVAPPVQDSSPLLVSPLTSDPGLEHQPRISPDGANVLYVAQQPDRGDWDLALISAEGAQRQWLANRPDVHEHGPAWSPDGREVAYVRLGADHCDVVRQTVIMGIPEALARCTHRFPTLVDWSVKQHIAFTRFEGDDEQGRRRISVIDLETAAMVAQSQGVSATGSDFYPRFSPQGDQLVFLRGEPQPDHRATVWLLDLNTGAERPVLESPDQYGSLSWIDEFNLLISRGSAMQQQAFMLEVASGQEEPLVGPSLFHLESSRLGALTTGVQKRNNRDLVLLRPDGQMDFVVASTHDDRAPAFSPDGRWLAFLSRRTGFQELWLLGLDSGAQRQLTHFRGASLKHPSWHPDGDRLLFTLEERGVEQLIGLHLVDASRQILETRWPLQGGAVWLGPETFAYGCMSEHQAGLCLRGPTGDEHLGFGFHRPHSGGEGLLVAQNDAGVLFAFPDGQDSPQELPLKLPADGRMAWTIHGSDIYFLAPDEQSAEIQLKRFSPDQPSSQVLTSGNFAANDAMLTVDPVTGSVAMTVVRNASDDLVRFNFPEAR